MRESSLDVRDESLRELGRLVRDRGGRWVLGRKVGDKYERTDHIKTGDSGVVVIEIVDGQPEYRPGDRGWIGSGSNKFRVESTLALEGNPPILCIMGTMLRGGFHSSKHNFDPRLKTDSDAV